MLREAGYCAPALESVVPARPLYYSRSIGGPPICHPDAECAALVVPLLGLALVAVLVIGLTQAGDKTERPATAPRFDVKAATAKLAGRARAARLALRGSRARSSTAARTRSRSASTRSPATPPWSTSGRRGAARAAPSSRSSSRSPPRAGRRSRFLGINGADKRPAAEKFLAAHPLPYPSYEDPHEDIAQERRAAKYFPITRVHRRERARPSFTHAGEYTSTAELERRHRQVPRVSELRVDPLTGLKTIIAAARADRPGGHFDLDPPPPINVEKDPFALGHEAQTPPEVYAVRPNGGGPDSPGWTVRVVPNLYPALEPDAPEPEPHANPDLYTAQAAAGHHEVIVNAPDPVSSLTDLTRRPGADRDGGVAGAHARARGLRVPAPDRQRAPRGRRLAPAHARAALRAALRPRLDRPRARALRRLRGAHDGRRPARRPRAGGGPPAQPDRGDRRRGGRRRAVRLARPVPADDRPAPLARPLRGRRPAGRPPAARRAVAGCAAGSAPARR